MKKLQTLLLTFTIILIGCGKEDVPAIPLSDSEKAWAPYFKGDTICFMSEDKTDSVVLVVTDREEDYGKYITKYAYNPNNFQIGYAYLNIILKSDSTSVLTGKLNQMKIFMKNRERIGGKEYEDILNFYYTSDDKGLFDFNVSKICAPESNIRCVKTDSFYTTIDSVWVQQGLGLIQFTTPLGTNYYLKQ